MINSRRKLVYIAQSCFCWLQRRCGSVLQDCGLYLVEPLPQAELQQLEVCSLPIVSLKVDTDFYKRKQMILLCCVIHCLSPLAVKNLTWNVQECTLRTTYSSKRFSITIDPIHLSTPRAYLYQCVRTSGTSMAEAYGSTHWAYPVRDQTGCAVAVIDLGVKRGLKISYTQNREVMRIMKLLSLAYHELLELRESKNIAYTGTMF